MRGVEFEIKSPHLASSSGAQSASARKKMLSGVVVLVLGLLSLPGGLFVYSRNLRGAELVGPTFSVAFQGRVVASLRLVTRESVEPL